MNLVSRFFSLLDCFQNQPATSPSLGSNRHFQPGHPIAKPNTLGEVCLSGRPANEQAYVCQAPLDAVTWLVDLHCITIVLLMHGPGPTLYLNNPHRCDLTTRAFHFFYTFCSSLETVSSANCSSPNSDRHRPLPIHPLRQFD